jgi:hypothetical protein
MTQFFTARQAEVLAYRSAAITYIQSQLAVGTPERTSFDALVATGPLTIDGFTFAPAYTIFV